MYLPLAYANCKPNSVHNKNLFLINLLPEWLQCYYGNISEMLAFSYKSFFSQGLS